MGYKAKIKYYNGYPQLYYILDDNIESFFKDVEDRCMLLLYVNKVISYISKLQVKQNKYYGKQMTILLAFLNLHAVNIK